MSNANAGLSPRYTLDVYTLVDLRTWANSDVDL
jgi:hypothetical protein